MIRIGATAAVTLTAPCVVIAGAASVLAASPSNRVATTRTRHVLGYTVDGRPIVAWLIAPRQVSRSMLVVGSIAGDEPGGVAVTKRLASQAAIAGVRLWLIPDANPDGLARRRRENAHGVDLNRNFPFRWRRHGAPGSRYYSGPRSASEPETRAIASFIRRTRPGLAVWLHQPYRLIDDSQGPRWAERHLSRALGLPLRRLTDYPGSAIGWSDQVVHASAFDVELPGGHPGQRIVNRVANAIRSLGRRYATDHPAH